MSGIKERRDSMDAKLTHDSELRFRVANRRNLLLGRWAAAKLGKTGDAAERYARSVVRSDFEEAGDDDVLRRVVGDLDGAGVSPGGTAIRAEMDRLLGVSFKQSMEATA